MSEEDAKEMGMFRFSVISPLLTESPEPLKERFTALSEQVWTLPNGSLRQYSADTVEDWYYDYRNHGLPALIKPPRRDKGRQRILSEEVCAEIEAILKQKPSMRGSTILQRLDNLGLRKDGVPSDPTIYRHLRKVRPSFHTKKKGERRAFEAPYPGALCQTDLMYGPFVPARQPNGRFRKQQTYLIAIIDDHSRLICHAEFFLSQGLGEYLQVLEQAIRKRGVPDKIYCDNGKIFLAAQVKRIGAEIGTRIIHTAVRDAAAKGKIERWFLTVRTSFLEGLVFEKVNTLAELNRRFSVWVEAYNQKTHSSLGCSPLEKWMQSPRQPRLLTDTLDTDDLFWLETTRQVKKDGTFSLLRIRYETNYTLAGGKVTVRYTPQDLSRVHVYYQAEFIGCSFPLNPGANNNLPRK